MSTQAFGPIGGNGGSLPPKRDRDKLQGRSATANKTEKMQKISLLLRVLNVAVNSKIYTKIANMAPFIMLAITVLTTFLRMITGYHELYSILSQVIGYSILTNIVFLLHAVRCQYSEYSIIATLSLLALNFNQVIAIVFGFESHAAYIAFDAILIVALFLISLKKYLRK